MRNPRILVLMALAALAGVIILAGSGQAKQNKAASPVSSKRATLPSKSAAEIAATGFTPRFAWTWHESASGGYRYSTTLRVGRFAHLGSVQVLPGFTSKAEVISSCSGFSESTDAVAPAEISMTNNTKGFSATLETSIYMVNPSAYPYGEGQATSLTAAISYGGEVRCYELTDWNGDSGGQGWTPKWTNKIPPGESTGSDYAYLILHNYYSPATPGGDPNMLHNANLEIGSYPQRSIVSMQGPGVFRGPSGAAPIIPLGGKRTCEYKESENGIESSSLACG